MANRDIYVSFPKGQIIKTAGGNMKLEYNKNYENKFNNNLNKIQVFIDNKVINYLGEYVKYKSGTMQKSIRLASEEGSGYVTIGVPYAEVQAYKIKSSRSKDPKRGARPFERMKADKKESILKQTAQYAKRLMNG